MRIQFSALPTNVARAFQKNNPDANNQNPETVFSDGTGNPCRHCLIEIPRDEKMLILAYRPFDILNPYAEVGPIFLCAHECKRHSDTEHLPNMFSKWDRLLVRGYSNNDRIVYNTGQVVEIQNIEQYIKDGFRDPSISYYHLRSASNNCYQAKVVRIKNP